MRALRIIVVIILAAAFIASDTQAAGALSRNEIEAFYSYDPSAPLEPVEIPLGATPWYQTYEIRYSSLDETVYARLFVPNAAPVSAKAVPCLVGLHGMFSSSIYQFWSIADFCARRGIAVMTPSLPYHHKRTQGLPIIPGQQLIIGSPDVVRSNLRRAVVDTRRAVDWVSTCPWIDQDAVSIAGVSLGGIVASLAFKVEPRFANGVFVVAGSGVGGILEHGSTQVLDIFRAAAKAKLVNVEHYIEALEIADPINVPDLVPRPALLMNGVTDIIMDPDTAVQLRDSMAQAEQIWTTGGHYFPLYAAEYLLMDYLAAQYATLPAFSRGVYIDAGSGFVFTEKVCQPEAGADNLWVDIRAELGRPGLVADHKLSVPMVNRAVPVVAMSQDTYSALSPLLQGRHLPAFVYLINDDTLPELNAALAYTQALGSRADTQLYYIAPLTGESAEGAEPGYRVDALSAMDVSRARAFLEPLLSGPGALGNKRSAAASLQAFSDVKLFCGPDARGDVASYLVQHTAVGKLKTIPWFPDYPHDDPVWSLGPGN